MKIYLYLTTFLFLFLCVPTKALSLSSSTANSISTESYIGQEPVIKSLKKHSKKIKTAKKFPLFATLSATAAVLTLFMLGLGIFLKFNIFMGIIAALLAISALILAIIGIKKGESRSFNFIGIMIGAVGLLGAIFFAISL